MLDIPVFLYSLMYIVFASAIPVFIMMFILRMFIKSGKKTYNTLTK